MKAEWVKLSQIKKMEKSAFENNYEGNRFFVWHVEYLKGKEGQQFFILFFVYLFLFSLWIVLHEFHGQNDAPVPVSLVNKEKYNVTGSSRKHPVRSQREKKKWILAPLAPLCTVFTAEILPSI